VLYTSSVISWLDFVVVVAASSVVLDRK